MIIDITGFGWSGSGAFVDFLSEYNENNHSKAIKHELAFLHNVDGIMDLEFKLVNKHCRTMDSDIAIKRFLSLIKGYCDKRSTANSILTKISNNYIRQITGIKYLSCSSYDRIYLYHNKKGLRHYYNLIVSILFSNRLSRKVFGKSFASSIRSHKVNTKYLSYCPENFLSATQDYMSKLFDILRGNDQRNLITDHLLPPDNPYSCLKYIGEEVKCIVVRRDPRDTYILAKEIYNGKIPIPVDTVDDFIWFYKHTIEETKTPDSNQVINLNFEDLIYDFERTKKIIEKFLGISKHANPLQFFDPAISINNTQLFKKYSKYSKDINKIEQLLANSLYDFGQYSDMPNGVTSTF